MFYDQSPTFDILYTQADYIDLFFIGYFKAKLQLKSDKDSYAILEKIIKKSIDRYISIPDKIEQYSIIMSKEIQLPSPSSKMKENFMIYSETLFSIKEMRKAFMVPLGYVFGYSSDDGCLFDLCLYAYESNSIYKEKYITMELINNCQNSLFNLLKDLDPKYKGEEKKGELQDADKKQQQQAPSLEEQKVEQKTEDNNPKSTTNSNSTQNSNTTNNDQKEQFKDCQICFEEMNPQTDHLIVLECDHFLHRQCVLQSFKIQVDERKFPFKCPECSKDLSLDFAKMVFRHTEYSDYQNKIDQFYLKNFLEQNTDILAFCLTPDCPFAFEYRQGDKQFNCPVCKKKYCLDCKIPWHGAITCAEAKSMKKNDKDDTYVLKYCKSSGFKRCPQCKFYVQKSSGCNHMSCRCGAQFCYRCGTKYEHSRKRCSCY